MVLADSLFSRRVIQPGLKPKSVRDSGLYPWCILLTDPPDAHILAQLPTPRPLAAGPVPLRCRIERAYKNDSSSQLSVRGREAC